MKNNQKKFIIITLILLIILSGCSVKKNENANFDKENTVEGEEIDGLELYEENTKKDNFENNKVADNKVTDNISDTNLMKAVFDKCLSEYNVKKSEDDEWIIYECEPIEDTFNIGISMVGLNKNFKIDALTYQEAKSFLLEMLDYDGEGYILETLQWRGNELVLVSEKEVTPE